MNKCRISGFVIYDCVDFCEITRNIQPHDWARCNGYVVETCPLRVSDLRTLLGDCYLTRRYRTWFDKDADLDLALSRACYKGLEDLCLKLIIDFPAYPDAYFWEEEAVEWKRYTVVPLVMEKLRDLQLSNAAI
jgi:hypothetical protein